MLTAFYVHMIKIRCTYDLHTIYIDYCYDLHGLPARLTPTCLAGPPMQEGRAEKTLIVTGCRFILGQLGQQSVYGTSTRSQARLQPYLYPRPPVGEVQEVARAPWREIYIYMYIYIYTRQCYLGGDRAGCC